MDKLTINSTITLNDGNSIPLLGFGVFQLDDEQRCETAVLTALEAGYRHVDAALKYGNEAFVGAALAKSGVPRGDFFLTTKASFDHDEKSIRDGFASSLESLQTDYVDLFLIHWPMDDAGLPGAWETLLTMKEEGLCRSVGVSNMSVRRFDEVFFKHNDQIPAVNQVELHVYNQQPALVDYCRQKGMVMEAYSSLARAEKLADPGQALSDIAAQVEKSAAQVMLRFLVQQDIVTLVKSETPARIRENAAIFDFELNEEQMATLTRMNEDLFVRDWAPDGYY